MSGKGTQRGEFELIAALFSPLAHGAAGALSLKDDAAFIGVAPGCELALTTDTLIAGVHFRKDDPPDLIARKALRVNLSDLAAKGARPRGFLHALALNSDIDDAFLERYAAGLASDVKDFNVPLLGGDTTSGPGPLTITITAIGEVEKGKALLRGGAKPGDIVCASGSIGDGALGLACLTDALPLPPPLAAGLVDRYRLPQPRLTVGEALKGIASACLDVSDGLIADLGHLCDVSQVSAVIHREKVPLSPGAKAALEHDARWWESILAGGDDYELVFTVPPERVARLEQIAAQTGVPLTAIGEIADAAKGNGVTVLANGEPFTIARSGYRHR